MRFVAAIIIALAVCIIATSCSAATLPVGNLIVMIAPISGSPQEMVPFMVDTTTGTTKQLNTQPINVNITSTRNGAAYNKVTNQLQFTGQPVGSQSRVNAVIGVDVVTGRYTVLPVYGGGGHRTDLVGLRRDHSTGEVYGVSAVSPGWDMRSSCLLRTILHDADPTNKNITTELVSELPHYENSLVMGNIAISKSSSSSKSDGMVYIITDDYSVSERIQLYTINLSNNSVVGEIKLASQKKTTYHTLCYDETTQALYSLQQNVTSGSLPQIFRLDAFTGASTLVVEINDASATLGDCYAGWFFVTSTGKTGQPTLYVIDLEISQIVSHPLQVAVNPLLVAFIPH